CPRSRARGALRIRRRRRLATLVVLGCLRALGIAGALGATRLALAALGTRRLGGIRWLLLHRRCGGLGHPESKQEKKTGDADRCLGPSHTSLLDSGVVKGG